MSAEQLAHGIIEIANWNQANAIRQMTIQRGIDPRGFALLSFGGAGPAQSPAVMDLLGMKACIVPPNPGNLSAFGLLAVDWRTDQIVTKVMHQDSVDLAAVAAIYAELEHEAVETLDARRHRALAHAARARGRRALRRPVDGGARAGAGRRGRCRIPCRPDRRLQRRAQAHLRLQLRRPAEDRDRQFLRLRLRPDRAAGACRSLPSATARRRRARRSGRSISTARSATRRSTTARRCCPASGSTVRPWSRSSARPPSCSRASILEVDPHGVLIVRSSRRPAEVKR